MKIIAKIYNDYNEKFGIPRQSGLAGDMKSTIVFEPEYRDENALRGIEEFSHIWLIWQFSECEEGKWRPTVRPPRLGGNKRVGVFATRSPFRPNSIGLSSVKLEEVKKTEDMGTILIVSGADLKNMTPIYDIKPYISYTDSHADAVCGFADEVFGHSLEVRCSKEILEEIEEDKRNALIDALKNDPRPAYHDDERTYFFSFGGYEIEFKVNDGVLNIERIAKN